jgi:hypothetical protein
MKDIGVVGKRIAIARFASMKRLLLMRGLGSK